jgi:hypothetical protein
MCWDDDVLDDDVLDDDVVGGDVDDIEAIKVVQARYCRAADTRDWDLLRTTVTDDFSCDTGPGGLGATVGWEAFLTRMRSVEIVTVHVALLPEIELTSDSTATGIWAAQSLARTPDGLTVETFGHYHNEYVKTDGAWRLSVLRLEMLHREIRPPAPAGGTGT